MQSSAAESVIERSFRNQVKKDKKVKSAFLLVDSDKLGIHLNFAEGGSTGTKVGPKQPNHMASVGKLFTATLIGILYEEVKLNYNDSIGKYLDSELMENLLVYKGRDFSGAITIRHLLMQTSGLNDVFYHLWKKIQADPDFKITPREAVLWGKKHLK